MAYKLPQEAVLVQFTLCRETKDRRLSQIMRKYCFPDFGSLALIQQVESAIMSLDNYFVRTHLCSPFTEEFVAHTLIDYFDKIMVSATDSLINKEYLTDYLTLSATKTETFLRKFTRQYRKCVVDQLEWIYNIFKNSPQYVVNHALHNFIMGEKKMRLCQYYECENCKFVVSQGDTIFGFIRSGFGLLFIHRIC